MSVASIQSWHPENFVAAPAGTRGNARNETLWRLLCHTDYHCPSDRRHLLTKLEPHGRLFIFLTQFRP